MGRSLTVECGPQLKLCLDFKAHAIAIARQEASWNTQRLAIQGFWFQDSASEP
jgi:hypothetical protein